MKEYHRIGCLLSSRARSFAWPEEDERGVAEKASPLARVAVVSEKKKRIIDKQFTQFPAVSLAPSPASTPLLRQEVVRDLPSAEVSHGEPQHGPQLAHRLRQYLGLRDRDQRSKANANRGKDEPAGYPGEVGRSLPLEVFQGVREPLALVLLDGVRVRAVLIPRELWGGS